MNNIAPHRQILYGLTADPHFYHLLNQPLETGHIEQVFNKAINFSINNSLFTLLCSQLDNAPNSCRLLIKDFSLFDIHDGDIITINSQYMTIGEKYSLSFELCKKWQPPPIEYNPNNQKDIKYFLFLKKQINDLDLILKNHPDTLFNYQGDNVFYFSMARKLIQLRVELIELIKQKKRSDVISVISQFVGLGIGLTPTGDDYLVGLMSILLLKHHFLSDIYSEFYQGITPAKAQTTPISAVTLEKALCHEYRENMYRLIQSIVDGNNDDMQANFLAILNIGSSSGCDMLFGVRDALYLTHYFGETDVD